METIIGLMIPFLGTVFGSLMVYFLKSKLNRNIEIIILGFSAGVMIAASIWSLIMPAIELVNSNIISIVLGLLISVIIFFIIDLFLDKKDNINKDHMMLAITIHNIPEGMAIGIAYASLMSGVSNISFATCLALSIGIGIQNFPEGAIVSIPLRKKGFSKTKSFIYGIVSAIFELLGALVTLLFTNIVEIILPFLLAFAAGAMIYVVIIELIPESNHKNRLNVIGFILGFLVMMVLDVLLG